MNRLRAHRRDRGETLIGVLIALSIKLDAAIERGEAERLKLE